MSLVHPPFRDVVAPVLGGTGQVVFDWESPASQRDYEWISIFKQERSGLFQRSLMDPPVSPGNLMVDGGTQVPLKRGMHLVMLIGWRQRQVKMPPVSRFLFCLSPKKEHELDSWWSWKPLHHTTSNRPQILGLTTSKHQTSTYAAFKIQGEADPATTGGCS